MSLKKYLTPFIINKLILINIAFFILCISTVHSFTFDQHRAFELVIIFFNVLLILLSSSFRKTIVLQFFYFPLTTRLSLLSLLLLATASIFFSPLSFYASLETGLYIGLFLLSLAIAPLVLEKSVFQIVFFITAITSVFFYQTVFFAGYLASFIENIPLQWPEPFSGFDNVRFFNQYHLWLFFFISLPVLIYSNSNERLLKSIRIIAIGWAILLFASGSRGAVIAIFLTLLIAYLIFKQHAILIIKLNLRVLCLGFIGSLLLFKLLPRLLQSDVVLGWRSIEQISHDAPRLYLWKTALNYMMTHPWLGIGAMHYAYYPNSIAAHPHNSFLQWAAEMGLPSAMILTFLIIWGLTAWVNRFNVLYKNTTNSIAEQQLWIGLFCSMSAGLIYSMVDGVIVMPVSQILMMTIVGWMFGLYFRDDKINMNVTIKQNITILILTGITLITLTYTVMPYFTQWIDKLNQDSVLIEIESTIPRFWGQGKIPN